MSRVPDQVVVADDPAVAGALDRVAPVEVGQVVAVLAVGEGGEAADRLFVEALLHERRDRLFVVEPVGDVRRCPTPSATRRLRAGSFAERLDRDRRVVEAGEPVAHQARGVVVGIVVDRRRAVGPVVGLGELVRSRRAEVGRAPSSPATPPSPAGRGRARSSRWSARRRTWRRSAAPRAARRHPTSCRRSRRRRVAGSTSCATRTHGASVTCR